MNARMFAALPFAVAIGLFAAPALAQNATPASSGSTMSHDSMHKDAMKGSMHKHGAMMKKDDSMHHGAMMKKHDSMHHGAMMKHDSMHHGAMMKKDDSMKKNKAGSAPKSSGG